MVLEAAELGCVDEVIVIAAALSIQDVRERPADQQAQADQAHARFRRRALRLPRLLEPVALPARAARRAVRATSSASSPRASSCTTCASASGRTSSASCARRPRASASRATSTPAEPRADPPGDAVRAAVARRAARTRRGASTSAPAARGSRLWPGSRWREGPADVGDGRRARRDLAAVGPRPRRASTRAGSSRSPSTWSSAPTTSRAGSRKRGAVVATERVTLYGLPIVAGRTVAYGQIDPELSRDLFLRRALVEGEWDTRHHFFAENRALRRGGRGARGARAPPRHPRRRPDALRLLRRARCRRRRLRRGTSTAGGATRAAREPELLTYTARAARRPRRASAGAAGRPDAGARAS